MRLKCMFWAKTKVRLVGGLLDKVVQFVHVCSDDSHALKNFRLLS